MSHNHTIYFVDVRDENMSVTFSSNGIKEDLLEFGRDNHELDFPKCFVWCALMISKTDENRESFPSKNGFVEAIIHKGNRSMKCLLKEFDAEKDSDSEVFFLEFDEQKDFDVDAFFDLIRN